jgi:hypothetical protein
MEVYEGPQLTPPTISLLTSADIVPMESDRWERGFQLINEGLEAHGIFATTLCPAEDTREYTATGANESYDTFGLFATDSCSTWPSRRAFFDRAQRKLLTAESSVLERQLWDSSILAGQPHLAGEAISPGPGTNVVGVTTIPMTAVLAKHAFALMDQKLGELSATRGMIHLRPQVIHALLEAQTVRRVGNIYLSPMDNIVVPGRGYPGTGPTGQAVGATEWMYGHPGIVQIRRGAVVRLGENDANSPTIVRSTNDKNVIVQRVVSVALDTTGGTLAIEFDSVS